MSISRRTGTEDGTEFTLAAWAELRSEEGTGSADGHRAAVRQARVGADVSRPMQAGGLALEPFGEAHFRRDGGTGQIGSELEVAGGVRAAAGRVRIDAQGKLLAAHSTEGYGEMGASLALSVGARGGQGPSLSVASNWGTARPRPGCSGREMGSTAAARPHGAGCGRWMPEAATRYGSESDFRAGSAP